MCGLSKTLTLCSFFFSSSSTNFSYQWIPQSRDFIFTWEFVSWGYFWRRIQIFSQNRFLTIFWIPKLWFFKIQARKRKGKHVPFLYCSFILKLPCKFCLYNMWTLFKKNCGCSLKILCCEKWRFENFLRVESKKLKLNSRICSKWKTDKISPLPRTFHFATVFHRRNTWEKLEKWNFIFRPEFIKYLSWTPIRC